MRRVDPRLFTASVAGIEVGRASIAIDNGVWETYSTIVDPAHEGRGIGARLARAVLDAAGAAGARVIPSCWFIDSYMQRHADEYGHLRARWEVPAAGSADDPTCRIAPAVLDR